MVNDITAGTFGLVSLYNSEIFCRYYFHYLNNQFYYVDHVYTNWQLTFKHQYECVINEGVSYKYEVNMDSFPLHNKHGILRFHEMISVISAAQSTTSINRMNNGRFLTASMRFASRFYGKLPLL